MPRVSNFSTILYAQTDVPCHRLKRLMMSHRRGYFPLPDKESKREKNRIAGAPGGPHIICIEHCGKPCRRVHLRPAGRGSVQEALFGVPSRRRELKAVKNIVEIIRYPPAVMPDFAGTRSPTAECRKSPIIFITVLISGYARKKDDRGCSERDLLAGGSWEKVTDLCGFFRTFFSFRPSVQDL